MNRISYAPLLALLAGVACRTTPPPAPAPDPSTALAELSREYWELTLRRDPVWATFLGDRRFDRALQDLSPEAHRAYLEALTGIRARAVALDEAALAPQERITRRVLLDFAGGALDTAVCQLHLWEVDPLSGVQVTLGELPGLHAVRTAEEGEALVARYRQAGEQLDQHIANLRVGQARGYRAPAPGVQRVVAQLTRMLEPPPERSAFVTTVALPPTMAEAEQQALTQALVEAVTAHVYPGLRRYLAFLREEYAPRRAVGVAANPDGAQCYAARIRAITGSEQSAEEIHRIGLEEVARAQEGMRAIAQKRIGVADAVALQSRLEADPRYRVQTAQEFVAYNERLIARAKEAMPRAFHRLPQAEVAVKPIEAFREQDAPAGYYYKASDDGTRSAHYYVNTYDAPSRPLYLAEPLAFHEALPGHHVQIGLAQELKGLPDFRRHERSAAFTEGWAHYAELLADELGLYSDDAGRFGMWSDQGKRAVRLVVDTGLHALGWDRERAIAYMVANTADAPEEVAREVDRYIVWPAQALAYKLGQLEVLRAREEAQARLGGRFDLRDFHEVVLRNGSVPLPVLRAELAAWLRSAAAE